MAGEIQLNSVSLATESGGTVTLNSSTDIKGCINASGSAPIYACRAWINFDGTSASIGTGRANGNASGVTDNGTGNYTITFTTAMPDANYSINSNSATGSAPAGNTAGRPYAIFHSTPSTTSLQIYVSGATGGSNTDPSLVDRNYISVAIFR